MNGLNKPSILAAALFFLGLSLAGTGKSGQKASLITLAWQDNFLTIHHPSIPGGKIETWYLEAYCRPESTNRVWNKTLIGHKTKLIDISDDKTQLRLRCTLEDGVTVDHVIRAIANGVSF